MKSALTDHSIVVATKQQVSCDLGEEADGPAITIFGTGQQSRCFCDVKDAVQAILRLVDSGQAVGEVVNIGSDQEVTIEALARLVKQRTASSSPITYIPYDQAYEPGFEDMLRRLPSLEKLQTIAGGEAGGTVAL